MSPVDIAFCVRHFRVNQKRAERIARLLGYAEGLQGLKTLPDMMLPFIDRLLQGHVHWPENVCEDVLKLLFEDFLAYAKEAVAAFDEDGRYDLPFFLSICDDTYVTWSRQTRYYDSNRMEWFDELPVLPLIAKSFDLGGMLCRSYATPGVFLAGEDNRPEAAVECRENAIPAV